MPVLGQDHVAEPLRQAVDQGHDLVPARHRQGTARTEVVLHVDHQEDGIVIADRHGRHGFAPRLTPASGGAASAGHVPGGK